MAHKTFPIRTPLQIIGSLIEKSNDTPALEPTSDFLAGFKTINPEIPDHFFTREEEELIRSLFQHPLTTTLCLIDFLGFDFYQTISRFNTTCQSLKSSASPAVFTKCLEGFCDAYISFYVRVMRKDRPSNPETPSEILDRVIPPESEFPKAMDTIRSILGASLPQLPALLTQAAAWPQPELAKDAVLTRYRSAVNDLKRLSNLKDLWAKIIKSPFCQLLLLDRKVSEFPGHEMLFRSSYKPELVLSKQPAISEILALLNFLDTCFLMKSKFIYFDDFRKIHDFIVAHGAQQVDVEFIRQWNSLFHQRIGDLNNIRQSLQADIKSASEGELTPVKWQRIQGLERTSVPQDPTEFVEALNFSRYRCSIAELWIEDVNTLVEQHLFVSFIPDPYRPKALTTRIVMDNLHHLSEWTPSSHTSFHASLPVGLQKCQTFLKEEIARASQSFFSLLNNPEQHQIFNIIYEKVQEDTCTYGTFFIFLESLQLDALIDDLEKKLPDIQRRYTQQLTDFLKTTPLDQRQDWVSSVEADYCYQVNFVFLVVSAIYDIEKVRKKFSFLTDFDFTLRPAFAQFFQLTTDLESLFNTIPAPTEEKSSTPAKIAQPSLEKKRSAPPTEVRPKDDRRELLEQLKVAKKRREFEAILKKLNFFFLRSGKGHQIWSDEGGSHVVLPFHNGSSELKPGTQHSIVKQVADSFEKAD